MEKKLRFQWVIDLRNTDHIQRAQRNAVPPSGWNILQRKRHLSIWKIPVAFRESKVRNNGQLTDKTGTTTGPENSQRPWEWALPGI